MKKLIILIFISALVLGCASREQIPLTVYKSVEVESAVYRVPRFDIPPIPELPINQLDWSNLDDHNAVGKAYVLSVDVLETYILQLRNLLEGIKKGEDP